ncbi:MAG: YkgJ family cysteine cluster protein [Bacteroidia bacterium]
MQKKLSTPLSELSISIKKKAEESKKANLKFIQHLKRKKPKDLDMTVQEIHDEVFENTDCLSCANCCKTTSPIFYEHDIERLSKRLKTRPAHFIEKYLNKDEDDDWVLKSAPCPFLLYDNRCEVYEDRPAACRTYPHTNRKKFHQLLDLTYQNSFVCPAVQTILEKLTLKFPVNHRNSLK